jgi:Putative amidoligase enzyme
MDVLREQNKKKNEFVLCPGRDLNRPCYYRRQEEIVGDVGLELEIEGNGLPTDPVLAGIVSPSTKRQWLSIQDGSLRNGGREYVLSGPIKTTELRHMIDGLYERIRANGGRVDNSNRCSTHVHVNVSDLKVNQLTSVLALWITFQTCLTAWNGVERVTNHFCLSTRDEESMLEAWQDFLTTGAHPERGYRDNVKYTALNILPIWFQGSLEFRVGGPPDDPDKVVYWAKICNAIVRYAAEHYANPLDYGHALSEQGPEGVLRSVLEFANLGPITTKRIYEELTASETFHVDCMEDFRDAQFMLYAFPWAQLMDQINQEFVPNPFNPSKGTKKIKMMPMNGRDMVDHIIREEALRPPRAPMPRFVPAPPPAIWDDED